MSLAVSLMCSNWTHLLFLNLNSHETNKRKHCTVSMRPKRTCLFLSFSIGNFFPSYVTQLFTINFSQKLWKTVVRDTYTDSIVTSKGAFSVTDLWLGEEGKEKGASGSRQDQASHTLRMSQEHRLWNTSDGPNGSVRGSAEASGRHPGPAPTL